MKLTIKKKKTMLSAALAAVVFLVCWIFYSWRAGVVFSALFLLTGMINLEMEDSRWQILLDGLWGICSMAVTFYASRIIGELPLFADIGFYKQLLNILSVAIVCGLLFLVSGRWRFSVVLGTFLMMFLATANDFVYHFRGRELIFIDIFAFRTAMGVVDQYEIMISKNLAYGWFMWGIVMLCQLDYPAKQFLSRGKARMAAVLPVAAMAIMFCTSAKDIQFYLWYNEGSLLNGCYLNFYISAWNGVVQEPDHYSSEQIESLETAYARTGTEEKKDYPNIIVIMNESFADLRVLGDNLHTNQPFTPFLDSLDEDTVRGYALASVYGGTTPNSEFEVLTGLSMANLPEGSVPYQQYLNENTYSLAWLLQSMGYECIGTHPYERESWSRNVVYPKLGFSDSTFMEDYPQKKMVRTHISDSEMYDYIFDRLHQTTDMPLFAFGVTVQNHSGYSYEGGNYTQTIFLEEREEGAPEVEQYLSLLRESDAAMEAFLTDLKAFPEDTVVLFFGDHFPALPNSFYSEVHGGAFESLREDCLRYTVPFFVWANYDIPEAEVSLTSLNYLSVYLLQAAGIPLPGYYQFLSEMEENIPAINLKGFYSRARGEMVDFTEATEEERYWLNRYEMIQYNCLFDQKQRSHVFFEQYIP